MLTVHFALQSERLSWFSTALSILVEIKTKKYKFDV